MTLPKNAWRDGNSKKSSRDEIRRRVGGRDVHGRAGLLWRYFGVAKSAVEVVSGHTAQLKPIKVSLGNRLGAWHVVKKKRTFPRMTRVFPIVLMIAVAVGDAQTGGPQSRPMPGPGLPFPRRGSKAKTVDPQELDSLKGVLRNLTNDELLVEADDKRMFTIIRNEKTKFLEKEEDVKVETIQPGDRVMVAASQDDKGKWTAVEVRVTKRAEVRVAAVSKPAASAAGSTATEPVERPTTEMAPAAPKVDVSEDDRPKLGRGRPAARKVSPNGETAAEEPVEVAKVAPPKVADNPSMSDDPRDRRPRGDEASAPLASAEAGARDEFIEKARDMAVNFSETLPAYTVKQFTTRFQSDNPRVNWQALDNVSADVVYDKGGESYKNILVNGKPPKGKVEDSGSWSTGEFATVLRDIFSRASDADFRPSGNATIVNRSTRVYKFVVEQPNSHWKIVAPGQFYFPAYKGTMWIDKETFRVIRIEMQTRNMPKDFSFDTVESTLDYDFIRLGSSNAYLLPVHAENLICVRHSSMCSKNIIDFRNYRKFGAESTIIFK